jgi:hypothetical protein
VRLLVLTKAPRMNLHSYYKSRDRISSVYGMEDCSQYSIITVFTHARSCYLYGRVVVFATDKVAASCSAREFGVGLFKRLACTCISTYLVTNVGQVIQDCSHTLNVASSHLTLLAVNETLAAVTFRPLYIQASSRASLYALILACTYRMHSRS